MFIDIDGIKINYLDEGAGKICLILHGWGCKGETYRKIIDRLSPHFRVIAPDLPGFGESPEPPSAWNVGDYANLVWGFCEALKIENAVLFGHSLGCRIIIKLISNGFPYASDKVILTGAAGIKPLKTPYQKLKALIYKIGKSFLMLKPVRRIFPNLLEQLQAKSGSADYRAASPIMRSCLVKIVNEDLTPLLSAVNKDVLLIWGENDDQTPLSDGVLMEKEMPRAGLAIIKNAGHYAFFDDFNLFMNIINSFLNIK